VQWIGEISQTNSDVSKIVTSQILKWGLPGSFLIGDLLESMNSDATQELVKVRPLFSVNLDTLSILKAPGFGSLVDVEKLVTSRWASFVADLSRQT
jgi:hypothetical protein